MNQENIDQTINQMLNLGILSNYGKMYKISDKFIEKMKEKITESNLDIEHAQVLTLFDFSDILNFEEVHKFNSVIEAVKELKDESYL